MDPSPEENAPLVSHLSGDPELQELVDEFVQNLPRKADALKAELARGDLEALSRLAHQLKGSAGGYGFPSITDAARYLEVTAKTTQDLETLNNQIREIADMCRRAVSKS